MFDIVHECRQMVKLAVVFGSCYQEWDVKTRKFDQEIVELFASALYSVLRIRPRRRAYLVTRGSPRTSPP